MGIKSSERTHITTQSLHPEWYIAPTHGYARAILNTPHLAYRTPLTFYRRPLSKLRLWLYSCVTFWSPTRQSNRSIWLAWAHWQEEPLRLVTQQAKHQNPGSIPCIMLRTTSSQKQLLALANGCTEDMSIHSLMSICLSNPASARYLTQIRSQHERPEAYWLLAALFTTCFTQESSNAADYNDSKLTA